MSTTNFSLSDEDFAKVSTWLAGLKEKKPRHCGAIGGAITYSFTPTSLGTIVKLHDSVTGEELDLTDYLSW